MLTAIPGRTNVGRTGIAVIAVDRHSPAAFSIHTRFADSTRIFVVTVDSVIGSVKRAFPGKRMA